MTAIPNPRWGARYSPNPEHDLQYLQEAYDEDEDFARRGELFLNEPLHEAYYVDADGIARRLGDLTTVAFSRIDFTGLREFANDAAAAAATPAVPVGGMYHTAGVLKVRRV
jgi:hypothetical protein